VHTLHTLAFEYNAKEISVEAGRCGQHLYECKLALPLGFAMREAPAL